MKVKCSIISLRLVKYVTLLSVFYALCSNVLSNSGKVGKDRNAANKESGPRPSDYSCFTIDRRSTRMTKVVTLVHDKTSLIEIFPVCTLCFRSIPRERNFCEVRLREMK